MHRYFIEVAYNGANYSGFQAQLNANTIQAEIEAALKKILRMPIALTGSSRTDAGVHAMQNFFHADFNIEFEQQKLYNLNAVLPSDIVIKNIYPVASKAHARFDAIEREYQYFISTHKKPFTKAYSYYHPYTLQLNVLQQAAKIIQEQQDFTSFSKQHTQVNNFFCNVYSSQWIPLKTGWLYHIRANRFLRGMIKGLVGTMLRVGRGNLSIEEFKNIFKQKNSMLADFSPPSKGLFLMAVRYPINTLTIEDHDTVNDVQLEWLSKNF